LNAEFIVNTFWFLSIFTAAIYILKKRYINKKEFSLINKVFKLTLSLTIIFCIIGLYLMLTNY